MGVHGLELPVPRLFCFHRLIRFTTFKTPTPPWQQGSWGQHGDHLGPIGPGWAPCWPHVTCSLGHSAHLSMPKYLTMFSNNSGMNAVNLPWWLFSNCVYLWRNIVQLRTHFENWITETQICISERTEFVKWILQCFFHMTASLVKIKCELLHSWPHQYSQRAKIILYISIGRAEGSVFFVFWRKLASVGQCYSMDQLRASTLCVCTCAFLQEL